MSSNDGVGSLTAGRRNAFLVATVVAGVVVALILLVSHGSAGASTTYADYSLLNNDATGGLTEVTSQEAAASANGPIWFANNQSEGPQPSIASARLASVDVAALRVWIAKSNQDGICVLALVDRNAAGPQGPASSCGRDLARGASIELEKANTHYIAGVVPNAVSAVTITLADGTTQRVAASDNAYAAEVDQPILSVSFDNAGVQETDNLGGQ